MAERLVRRPDTVERLQLARILGISYRRLHGWEPRSVQRGYDREGNRVALTDAWEIVTEVEAEWDDEERRQLLALAAYERGVCSGCGYHLSLSTDTSNFFTFEERTCLVCKGAAKFGRLQHEADQKVRDRHGDHMPPGADDPADGRQTIIRPMSLSEVEARRAQRG